MADAGKLVDWWVDQIPPNDYAPRILWAARNSSTNAVEFGAVNMLILIDLIKQIMANPNSDWGKALQGISYRLDFHTGNPDAHESNDA